MKRLSPSILFLLLTISVGIGFVLSKLTSTVETGAPDQPRNSEPEIAYWVAPMDPNYRRDSPGKSPMGMDLIPVYADEQIPADSSEPALRINPAIVNNIGVRTAAAEIGLLPRQINTVGFVTPNEHTLKHIHVRTSGWIDELVVNAVGETVEEGALLFRFYSPDLASAQAEYLQALNRGNTNLIRATEERLQALGMTSEQITAIATSRRVQTLVDVHAETAGTVLMLGIREGNFISPDDMIMSLADLSSVWVLVDIFENEASWAQPGQTATMRLGFAPGKTWEGSVDFVYPTVDVDSRTIRARLVFNNADQTLKPGMFADLTIDADIGERTLTIPRSALIRTSRNDRVVLALGEGRFRPAQVVSGIESGDRVQILEGLAAGEQVVTSGQFLIDSEASLDAALLRLTTPAHHGDHQ